MLVRNEWRVTSWSHLGWGRDHPWALQASATDASIWTQYELSGFEFLPYQKVSINGPRGHQLSNQKLVLKPFLTSEIRKFEASSLNRSDKKTCSCKFYAMPPIMSRFLKKRSHTNRSIRVRFHFLKLLRPMPPSSLGRHTLVHETFTLGRLSREPDQKCRTEGFNFLYVGFG